MMHTTQLLAYFAIPLGYHVAGVASSMQRLPAAAVPMPESGRQQILAAESSSSDIALQHQEYFYLGEAETPSNPLVYITGMANSSATRLLSTERFANTIQHMSCSPGQVDIRFSSPSSFQAARNEWQWVSSHDSNRIILVTGDSGCAAAPVPNVGSPASQQEETYEIKQATFSPSDLTVSLVGQTASLGELLDGQWSMKGSSSGIVTQGLQARLSKSGNIGLTESVKIPNIFNDKVAGPVNVSLDATLASTGNLQWEIDVDGFSIDDASVSLTTTGVSFTLTPQISLSGSVDAISPVSIDVPDIPLGPSLSGPLDSDLGLFLVVGAQASLGTVTAAMDVSIDLELALSDGTVSVSGKDGATHSGFSPTFSVHSPQIGGQVDLTSSVGPTIGIVLQASLLSVGVKGGIQLVAPEASLVLEAEASSTGSCGTGNDIGLEVDIGVGAQIEAIVVAGDVADGTTHTFNIFSTSTPIFSTCTAIGDSSSTTTITTNTAPTTNTVPTTTTGPTTTSPTTTSVGTAPINTAPASTGGGYQPSAPIWSNGTSSVY